MSQFNRVPKVISRKYEGVIISDKNYKDYTKEERNFHNKHLRAYLKGKSYFYQDFRKDPKTDEYIYFMNKRIPAMHEVQQEYIFES